MIKIESGIFLGILGFILGLFSMLAIWHYSPPEAVQRLNGAQQEFMLVVGVNPNAKFINQYEKTHDRETIVFNKPQEARDFIQKITNMDPNDR